MERLSVNISDLLLVIETTRREIAHISNIDRNFKRLYNQFLQESHHTLAWAEDFLLQLQGAKTIPYYHDLQIDEDVYNVHICYSKIREISRVVYDEYCTASTATLMVRGNKRMRRSYPDLKKQLDSIASSNAALKLRLVSISLRNVSKEKLSSAQNVASTSEYGTAAPLAETSLSEHEDPKRDDHQVDSVIISSLHALCLDSLIHISFTTTSNARQLAGLLERWSIGLFDETPVALDSLLFGESSSNKNLRQFILRTLVHIAIAEERIYKRLEVDEEPSSATHKHRAPLLLILNRSELSDFALQRWGELLELESEDNTDEDLDEKQHISDELLELEIKENTDEDLKKKQPVSNKLLEPQIEDNTEEDLDEKQDDFIERELDEIKYLVESLFDVSSSIRAARQSHILELEAQKSAKVLRQEKSPAELNKTKNEVEVPARQTKSSEAKSGELLGMDGVRRLMIQRRERQDVKSTPAELNKTENEVEVPARQTKSSEANSGELLAWTGFNGGNDWMLKAPLN